MQRCGHVGIVGRPNVGKSTLFNRLIGHHIASVSFKPQTTRHRILGVFTGDDCQMVLVDTPGIHQGEKKLINQALNKTAVDAMQNVDVLYWMVDVQVWTEEDERILSLVRELGIPVIVLLNKIDLLPKRENLLPILSAWSSRMEYAEIVPISAKDGINIERLMEKTKFYLPESEFLFPKDYVTDRDELFLSAEVIREGIFHYLSSEVPYACHVAIENFEDQDTRLQIDAVIWVETEGQKKILIGHRGEMVKRIGIRARHQLQKLFSVPVQLNTWVKVKKGWQDDPLIVRRYE